MCITPVLSNFTSPPVTSANKLLGSLTTASTTGAGKGKATWMINDFHGITQQLITTAYHVHDATIHLFSPQVYIDENPINSSLCSDSTGIALILTCFYLCWCIPV